MIRHRHVVHQSDPGCLARLRAQRAGADRPGEPAKIGTACHRAIEALAASVAAGEDTPVSAVVALAIKRAAPDIDMAPESVGEALQIMEGALESDRRLYLLADEKAAVFTELHWRLDRNFKPLPEDCDPADIAFAGTWDRVEVFTNSIVVTDWKTVRELKAGHELGDDWQARVYALAALQFWAGARKVTFRWVNLRHGYAISHDFERGRVWEAAVRARLASAADQRAAAIVADEWPETLGVDCNWCPVLHRCAAMREACDQGSDVAADMAPADIARRWIALKAATGRMERKTRALVKDLGGPLPLGDGSQLGHKPTVGYSPVLSYEATMAMLRDFGMTPELEAEWFRHCAKRYYPGRIRKAVNELLGREAREVLDNDVLVTPVTLEEFSVWTPDPTPREVTEEDVMEALATYGAGG